MFAVRLYFWVAPNLLLAVCLLGLLRRNVQKQYPVFTAYIFVALAQFLTTVVLDVLVVRSVCSIATYQWTVAITTGITSVFELGVLYELANELVLSRSAFATTFRPLLRWTAAVLLLVTVMATASVSQSGLQRALAAVKILDFSSSFIEIGLVVVLLLFARVLHVSWRSLPSGIALGFAISASNELAADVSLSAFGRGYYVNVDLARMVAFHMCVLVWLFYILGPERIAFTGKRLTRTDLELWNEELQRMVGR